MVRWLGWIWLAGCAPVEQADAPGNGQTIPTHGDAMVHSEGTRIVDGDGQPVTLRCVNIDGWLQPIPYLISDSGEALLVSPTEFAGRLDEVVGAERAAAFWSDYRDVFLTEADVERIAALGFTCARLPLYHRFADEDALGRVDQLLGWGLKHGVYVVLDLHAVPGGQNGVPTVSDVPRDDTVPRLWQGPDAADNQQATVDLWRSLAERFAGQPALAGYDLLNEPALPASVDPDELPALYGRIISAIREVDPLHMVIVEGDDLAHDFSAFAAYAEPPDDNLAYSFHAYALTGFEDWATPDEPDVADYLALRDAHQRPLWLGEFGEETLDWQLEVVELVEGHDIGWALYPWKRKQTWFFNPVLQRIPSMPAWYALSHYLARTPYAGEPVPSVQDAEAGMAELLASVPLAACTEDGALANRLMGR